MGLSFDEAQELVLIEENLRAQKAREEFLPFVTYVMPEYETNWHHKIIADRISQLPHQKRQILTISVPAQTGKSELVSRKLPAWYLGVKPDTRILLVSYGTEFAINFNRAVQKTIDSPEYFSLFPGTRLNTKNVKTISGSPKRTSDYFEVVGRNGFLRSVGLGAGSSGFPADLLIIDDPYPGIKEALSKNYRKMVWDWYTSVGYQRLSKDAHVIITHTRWDTDDLIGNLQARGKADPMADQWEELRFPSIAEGKLHPLDPRKPGQSLWPEWKGDEEALARKRALIGDFLWNAMEQQMPVALGGNLFKRSAWSRYSPAERPSTFDAVFSTWDANLVPNEEADSDYVAGFVIGLTGPTLWVLAHFHGRWEFPETIEHMKLAQTLYRPNGTIIENKAAGAPAVQTLKREIRGVIPYSPSGSKVSRALAVLPTVNAGQVRFPHEPWVDECLGEFDAFPKGPHDDRVDAVVQLILWLNENDGKRKYLENLKKMKGQ